jgi:hypothetical protein
VPVFFSQPLGLRKALAEDRYLENHSHMAYRTRSQQALDRRLAALKRSGYHDIGWKDDDIASGLALLCQDPDGHEIDATL